MTELLSFLDLISNHLISSVFSTVFLNPWIFFFFLEVAYGLCLMIYSSALKQFKKVPAWKCLKCSYMSNAILVSRILVTYVVNVSRKHIFALFFIYIL